MTRHHSKGQLGRADLLEALNKGDAATVKYLTAQLGLEHQPKTVIETIGIEGGEASLQPITTVAKGTVHQNKDILSKMGFWLLDSREPTVQRQGTAQKTQTVAVDWPPPDIKPPLFYPLTSPRSLLVRLLHHLKHQRQARTIDIDKIIKQLSRGKHILKFPKQTRRSLGRHLHIIDDRQLHLTPYWLDHTLFTDLVASLLPDYAGSFSVLQNGQALPVSINLSGDIQDWILPPPGSVVLVFSDLGALSLQKSTVTVWIKLAKKLQQRDCKLIAVIPCQPSECDKALQSLFILEPWEKERHITPVNKQQRLQQAEQLLMLLAPVIRLEPGLLRAARTSLAEHNIKMDAAVESLVWQHPAMQELSSVAASFSHEKRQLWLEQFYEQDVAVQKAVLEIIRSWRGGLSKQVWFEEITSLDEDSRQQVPEQDIKAASQYFQQLLLANGSDYSLLADTPTQCWLKRMEKRLPPESCKLEGIGAVLQQIFICSHQEDEAYHSKHPLDPAMLIGSNLPEQTAILYQQGEKLMLAPQVVTPELVAPTRLTSIRYRQGLLYLQSENGFHHSFKFQPQLTTPIQVISDLPDSASFLLRSDVETLHFKQIPRPDCFSQLGRDQYGLYADLEIKNVIQRFRWIEAGTFIMGSPETEIDRYDDEDLHLVTLTQGFWLADTVVTQALWLAVMDENPSRFTDDLNNPVENVSWDDAQSFIDKLNSIMPGLHACLPTEAQWEYACRAGTQTPFSFGDNITPEQVNYNGGAPYANGKKGLYREQTVAVKSLPANQWGLYEMHGNVWEWCRDGWQKNLGEQAVTDPVLAVDPDDPARVVRGGSWIGSGRNVRSAYRDGNEAGNRSYLGFRLSLGLQAGQAGNAFVADSGSRVAEQRQAESATKAGQELQSGGKDIFMGWKDKLKQFWKKNL